MALALSTCTCPSPPRLFQDKDWTCSGMSIGSPGSSPRADAARGSARAWIGAPFPLGSHWDGGGVNFALLSEHATEVEVCLFARPNDPYETERIPLPERTGHVWHGYIPECDAGSITSRESRCLSSRAKRLVAQPNEVFVQTLRFLGLSAWQPNRYNISSPGAYKRMRPRLGRA
jgi:hypothetical protein